MIPILLLKMVYEFKIGTLCVRLLFSDGIFLNCSDLFIVSYLLDSVGSNVCSNSAGLWFFQPSGLFMYFYI